MNKGYPQREITEASFRYQKEVEEKKRLIVGVNIFVQKKEEEIRNVPLLDINQDEIEKKQVIRLKKLREERDNNAVEKALKELKKAASRDENVMPYILDAVRKYATLGEVMNTLKEVYGVWIEPPIY